MSSSEANSFGSNKLTVEDSALTSLYGKNGQLGERGTFQDKIGNSMDNQLCPESTTAIEDNVTETLSKLHGFSKNLKPVDILEDLSKFCYMDDLYQWFDPSPENGMCATVTTLDNTLYQKIEFNLTYSSPVVSDVLSGNNPVKDQAVHNSVTTTVNLEGKQTFASMHTSDSALSDGIKLDFNCFQADEQCKGNFLTPVVNAATDSRLSECISELNNIGRLTGTRMFSESELGNEDRSANSNFLDRCNLEDRLSTHTRQRTDYSPAAVGARESLMQPVPNFGKTNRHVHKQDIVPKSQVSLRIDDNRSVKSVLPSLHRKPEEVTKATRKSPCRPQPKDLQQIQDRIKELRWIIPYGGKGNGVDSKIGGGSTWGLEVGGQMMVCPITVEDMSSPGQMLIEVLREEKGFFLEIADIIRRFGLNILKGKMEIRESKIWARFIVEAKRHVTRVDVFWFLIQLLQQTNTSGMDSDSCNGI